MFQNNTSQGKKKKKALLLGDNLKSYDLAVISLDEIEAHDDFLNRVIFK